MSKNGQTEFSKPISANTWLESSDVCDENQSAWRISKYKFLYIKNNGDEACLQKVMVKNCEDKLEDGRFDLVQLLPWCGD